MIVINSTPFLMVENNIELNGTELSFPDLFLNLGPKDFSSVEENALDF
jgi:hypothetical protein